MTATAAATEFHGYSDPVAPAIGRIWRNYTPHCTGTFITPDLIVTAAHCLYVPPAAASAQALPGYFLENGDLLHITPGSTGTQGIEVLDGFLGSAAVNVSAPYGVHQIVRTWVPAGYVSGDGRYDYGIAEVAGSPGATVGHYDLWTDLGATPGDRFLWVGYSGAGLWNTYALLYGNGQYLCQGTWDGNVAPQVGVVGTGVFLEKAGCPMSGGSSGGPVFKADPNGWFLTGVHNAGLDSDMNGFSELSFHNYLDSEFMAFWSSLFATASSAVAEERLVDTRTLPAGGRDGASARSG